MKIMGWQMPWGRLMLTRKNAPLMPASGGGGGWALLELTDALQLYNDIKFQWKSLLSGWCSNVVKKQCLQ